MAYLEQNYLAIAISPSPTPKSLEMFLFGAKRINSATNKLEQIACISQKHYVRVVANFGDTVYLAYSDTA